jgi:hypothetical protein
MGYVKLMTLTTLIILVKLLKPALRIAVQALALPRVVQFAMQAVLDSP